MLSFITFRDAPEQLEIVADSKGIEELIGYLNGINKYKDHIHLIIGNELEEVYISEDRKGKTLIAKHVRIEYYNEM